MIKAVFFDIDGTLLSHKTYSVPDSTVRALEQLRERGVLTFIATGRHLPELKKLQPLQGLRFDGYVTLNGQYCCNDTGVIYHCPIRQSDVAALLDFLKAEPHPCILVERTGCTSISTTTTWPGSRRPSTRTCPLWGIWTGDTQNPSTRRSSI